jgi:hypothetical protein
MITTSDAPAWLPPLRPSRPLGPHHAPPATHPPGFRRSDQAVHWARTILQRGRSVVIDCETTGLPGGVTGNDGYQDLRNSPRTRLPG